VKKETNKQQGYEAKSGTETAARLEIFLITVFPEKKINCYLAVTNKLRTTSKC